MEQSIACPKCKIQHVKSDEVMAKAIRAGVIGYVDALCPWCRFVYNVGRTLNSPLGLTLCVVAVGAVVIRIKESLS